MKLALVLFTLLGVLSFGEDLELSQRDVEELIFRVTEVETENNNLRDSVESLQLSVAELQMESTALRQSVQALLLDISQRETECSSIKAQNFKLQAGGEKMQETRKKEQDFPEKYEQSEGGEGAWEEDASSVHRQLNQVRDVMDALQKETQDLNNRMHQLRELSKMTTLPRTCWELFEQGIQLSGYYFIDPDGLHIGDLAVEVYCDMDTGTTYVSHDTLETMWVDHCAPPGCYRREVKYNMSLHQIDALTDLSAHCQQHIKYDCLMGTLEDEGTHVGWWVDRQGEENYYWSGAHYGVHVCSCGEKGNCYDTEIFNITCNCDAHMPVWMEDEGYIDNKTALPIMELYFGGLELSMQSAKYTLGPLECMGKAFIGTSESCADLKRAGATVSGYYMLKQPETQLLDIAFCNLTKDFDDHDFQVYMGHPGNHREVVFFDAFRNTTFDTPGTLNYVATNVNIGGGLDLSSGNFTAPISGVYLFTFHTEARNLVLLFLQKNGVNVGRLRDWDNDESASTGQSVLLELAVGDRVRVYIQEGVIYDGAGDYNTHFIGVLLYPTSPELLELS